MVIIESWSCWSSLLPVAKSLGFDGDPLKLDVGDVGIGLQTANSELSQWVILNKWVSNKCSKYASQLSLLEQADMSSSAIIFFEVFFLAGTSSRIQQN